MTLGQKQRLFAFMVSDLIQWAYRQGYGVTLGSAYRDPQWGVGQMPERSLHGKRLAIDLNLFKDGKWLRSTEAHRPLGEYWESIGGSWGGRFGDGNHYSLEHGGVK